MLRAFVNYCRHRGSVLLEGQGNCRRIVCPCHARSYLTDGRLHGCPDMKDAAGFEQVAHGLVPLRQDSMWWLKILPLAHDRSVLEIGGCFPQDVTERKDFDEMATAYYDRWRAVGREDVAILERQQRGFTSVLYGPGPLSWRDDQVQAAAKWVLARISGIIGE